MYYIKANYNKDQMLYSKHNTNTDGTIFKENQRLHEEIVIGSHVLHVIGYSLTVAHLTFCSVFNTEMLSPLIKLQYILIYWLELNTMHCSFIMFFCKTK